MKDFCHGCQPLCCISISIHYFSFFFYSLFSLFTISLGSLPQFDKLLLSSFWLSCPLASAMMELYSVTVESVKVRKQINKSNVRCSWVNNPIILLPCLFFYLLLVILSEWSEWTPCSPCVPSASLQHSTSQAGVITGSNMVSIQRRFRACLDLDSGLPVSREEEDSQCPGPLVEERSCPDSNICRGNGVCPRGQKEAHSEASQPFISVQKCSQFFCQPLSSSSCSFNSSVRKNNEWDSFAPPGSPQHVAAVWYFAPTMRLYADNTVNESELEKHGTRLGKTVTVVMKWLSLGWRGKAFDAKIWLEYNARWMYLCNNFQHWENSMWFT